MSRTFSLSVLVVSWNGRAHLESLLPSLAAQQPVDGCTTETLVLDNGSNDGTVEWIADTHPRVRVIARRDNLGFAGGNNLLAAEARGDVLLLLNNDMRAEPDLVARYAALWRSVPGDVAGLAGALTDWEGERLDFGRGVMTFDGHAFGIDQGRPLESARLPEEGEEMLFGCGGNLWICRRSFLEAGGFDPAYFAYFEDVDLGWRLWAGGQRLLACPGARARHRQSATSARLGDSRRGALFERNALATAVKNYEAGLWERMAPVVLLTFASRLADRLTGGAEGAVEWTHPQALAQLAGLGAFLGDVDAIAGERLRLAARRQRSDREIFRRFPLWIVPTYPGDEVLFGGEAFTTWLPEELEFRRASLSELLAIG